MKNVINTVIARVKAIVSPTVGDLLASVAKFEAKVEKAISKAHRDLEITSVIARQVADKTMALNAELDAAYKLLHKVSGLTK